MGTNITGIGVANGIGFNRKSSTKSPLPDDLKAKIIAIVPTDKYQNSDIVGGSIRLKDISGKGNDFIARNLAGKLNSGFGDYKEDFTSWNIYSIAKVTSSKITIKPNVANNGWIIYKPSGLQIPSFKVFISGIPDKATLIFKYHTQLILKNGINTIPEIATTTSSGFFMTTVADDIDWSNLVIEQIPDHEGSLVTDGVDDMLNSTEWNNQDLI